MTTTTSDTTEARGSGLVPVPASPQTARLRDRSRRSSVLRAARYIGVGVSIWAVVTYGILGPLKHTIVTDLPVIPSEETAGSAAVASAAALIRRELDVNGWTPNDPPIAPAAVLDNMPNFQTGVIEAVGRFSFEMLDQIARTRGSSSDDPDLERATGFLQFPPDIWIWEPSRSLLPSVSSETQYRQGLAALERYNARLARGDAVFEQRADTLAATLSRISADLGAQTAQLERAQDTGRWIFSSHADDVFYHNKGMLHGYHVLLSGLGYDFDRIIRERNLGPIWNQVLDGLQQGAQLRPLVVLNGDRDRSIFANHLALQGFYMKRAILQLEEAVNVLAV
ncbi:hypothetical protein CLV78_10732 [Aliiruegeria haliotis]|uniref:DUF2333 family protein n=1 Tax=Aliiruegeria haliotis TaxID=1280846 RepID=A0A2T0RLR0_9RHOB|nr:DUF2333 family protein [Aliiruegeria haliotis]PRY22108.1 hypothetical protein CLV78_10732 [Aliiruegeria haliotis]